MLNYLDLLKGCLTASLYDQSAWTLVEGPMPVERGAIAMAKRAIVRSLKKRGILLVRDRKYDPELREQGIDWPLFGFTMVGTKRLNNVQHCIEQVLKDKVPGDFVECGVWRGGSSIWAKALLEHHGATDRVVWCCDSFEGMLKPDDTDLAIDPTSDFSDRTFIAVSQEQVAANFRRFGLLDDRVRFVKGWFSESLPKAPIERIAVLRMDADLYRSTMDTLANLYRKVSPGGFVIVDDYSTWPGCKQAVDEYRTINGITSEMTRIDNSATFWRVH